MTKKRNQLQQHQGHISSEGQRSRWVKYISLMSVANLTVSKTEVDTVFPAHEKTH